MLITNSVCEESPKKITNAIPSTIHSKYLVKSFSSVLISHCDHITKWSKIPHDAESLDNQDKVNHREGRAEHHSLTVNQCINHHFKSNLNSSNYPVRLRNSPPFLLLLYFHLSQEKNTSTIIMPRPWPPPTLIPNNRQTHTSITTKTRVWRVNLSTKSHPTQHQKWTTSTFLLYLLKILVCIPSNTFFFFNEELKLTNYSPDRVISFPASQSLHASTAFPDAAASGRKAIPTGLVALDEAISISAPVISTTSNERIREFTEGKGEQLKGLPVGHVTEVFGPPGAGKTMLGWVYISLYWSNGGLSGAGGG